jgi:hypothetical protein
MVAIDKERITCIELLLDANVQVNDAALALILNRLNEDCLGATESDPPHPIFRRLVSLFSFLCLTMRLTRPVRSITIASERIGWNFISELILNHFLFLSIIQ